MKKVSCLSFIGLPAYLAVHHLELAVIVVAIQLAVPVPAPSWAARSGLIQTHEHGVFMIFLRITNSVAARLLRLSLS
jgi:hypothetical protein